MPSSLLFINLILPVLLVGLLQAVAGMVMTPLLAIEIFLSAAEIEAFLTFSLILDSLASPISVPTAARVTAFEFSLNLRCKLRDKLFQKAGLSAFKP